MKSDPLTEDSHRSRAGWRPSLDVAGVVGLNALAAAVVVFFLWQSHEQAADAAVATTRNLVRLLDDELSATFDRADSALFSVAEEVERQAEDGRPDLPTLARLMARQQSRVPGLLSLRIIQADGQVGVSSPPLDRPVSLADREYFVQLRDGATSVVSKPLAGRILDTPVVVLGRRLADSRGAFAGAVIGAFRLAYLENAITSIDVGREGSITLRTEDFTVLARKGPAGARNVVGQVMTTPELRAKHADGRAEGTYHAASSIDGMPRWYSFRKIGRFPFYAAVGLASRDYLSAWRRAATAATVSLVLFALLTGSGAWFVRRTWRQGKLAEEQLMRSQKVESLAVLAGGIAHDFNNLLTAISGNISVARERAPPGSEEAEALADAEAASQRARSLTHQLLTFSRGGAPLKRQVDLSALVEEAARFAMHGSGTALHLDVAPGLVVDADPGQLGQVVQNLVLNGVEAMASSGTLAVGARGVAVPPGPASLNPGRYALLTVTDAGPGIPPAALPRIFDPFFTTKAKGKGLGLAICHSIVTKHEGRIEAASPPGSGATFRVYLPVLDEGVAVDGTAPVVATTPAGDIETPRRLLVMDDEDAVRRLAGRLLKPLGYDVDEARDGEEAVARYAEAKAAGRPYSAVLMDLTIPGGVGGVEALGKLKAIDPEVVAIVSSGYSNDPVMAHWKDHGFSGCLAKPYVAAELREALGRLRLA